MANKCKQSNIHILTLNVQGVRDKCKQQRLFQWAKQQKANVLFLQETHLTAETYEQINRQFQGTVLHCSGSSNSRGVAILIHSALSYSIKNEQYSFINIYAPNDPTERNTFFKTLDDRISEHATGSIVLGGDFNEILDPKIDRRNKRFNNIPKKTKASHSLEKMRKNKNLIDIWRIENKQKIQFSWKRQALNEATRIDYFLIQDTLVIQIGSCDIRPAQIRKTSHLLVSLKIKPKVANRGPGLWKINNSI